MNKYVEIEEKMAFGRTQRYEGEGDGIDPTFKGVETPICVIPVKPFHGLLELARLVVDTL